MIRRGIAMARGLRGSTIRQCPIPGYYAPIRLYSRPPDHPEEKSESKEAVIDNLLNDVLEQETPALEKSSKAEPTLEDLLEDVFKHEELNHEEEPLDLDKHDDIDDNLQSFLDELNIALGSKNREDEFLDPELVQDVKVTFDDVLKTLGDSNQYKYQQQIYDNMRDHKISFEKHRSHLEKAKDALQPTLEYIGSIDNQKQLIADLNRLLTEASHILQDPVESLKLFLIGADYNEEITRIESHCSSHPTNPPLNVLTLPIIFNELLKISNNNFKDGQLTLTFFNYLKKDLQLYLVTCNQDTYNEILKTIWIFQGKLSLAQIDSLLVEMVNNGFQGNLVTFNILKQILLDYNHLRFGSYKFIRNILPIWNPDDEKRETSIRRKLRSITMALKSDHHVHS